MRYKLLICHMQLIFHNLQCCYKECFQTLTISKCLKGTKEIKNEKNSMCIFNAIPNYFPCNTYQGMCFNLFSQEIGSASLSSGFPPSFSIQLLTVQENVPLANDLMVQSINIYLHIPLSKYFKSYFCDYTVYGEGSRAINQKV